MIYCEDSMTILQTGWDIYCMHMVDVLEGREGANPSIGFKKFFKNY